MENAQLHIAELSAPNSASFSQTPRLTPRQRRALDGLWAGPLMREQLDRVAGCSNGPQLIKDLIDKGVEILCELIDSFDRDGRPCRPGRYSLTNKGRETLRCWGWE